MILSFDAPAMQSLATLPPEVEEQGLAVRQTLVAGAQPKAVVILLDIESRAAGGTDA